jgi:hypothetical protein
MYCGKGFGPQLFDPTPSVFVSSVSTVDVLGGRSSE